MSEHIDHKFVTHVDTQRLADMFQALDFNGTITYDQIIAEFGYDMVREKPGRVAGAKELAAREGGAIIRSMPGSGYYRVHPDRLAEVVGKPSRMRIGTTAKRGVAALIRGSSGHQGFPSEEAKRKIGREQALLGLVHHLIKDKNLPQAVAKPPSHADVAKAMLAHYQMPVQKVSE